MYYVSLETISTGATHPPFNMSILPDDCYFEVRVVL